jgi:plasmid stabilization system protein ParE
VVDAIFAAIRDVAQNPLAARRTSDPSVRVKVVSRYGYKIFYSVEADAIEILHVRHGARRPWLAERRQD